jgi:RsiW-degrading membrane proteinase PrsW (M82 family)
MTGLWVLLLLVFIAALPVLPAYVWFRSQKFPLPLYWFLLSLLTGAFSLLIAALLQNIFSSISRGNALSNESAIGGVFVTIFIRIALTEETGRLLALLLFLGLGSRFKKILSSVSASLWDLSFGAATGLLAGLGFAIIETASYGVMSIGIALLRAFTAAPLHGACGARIGMAVVTFKENPAQSIWRFFSAVAIHGMYNFMIISPGSPRIFPILIAFFSAFVFSEGYPRYLKKNIE